MAEQAPRNRGVCFVSDSATRAAWDSWSWSLIHQHYPIPRGQPHPGHGTTVIHPWILAPEEVPVAVNRDRFRLVGGVHQRHTILEAPPVDTMTPWFALRGVERVPEGDVVFVKPWQGCVEMFLICKREVAVIHEARGEGEPEKAVIFRVTRDIEADQLRGREICEHVAVAAHHAVPARPRGK